MTVYPRANSAPLTVLRSAQPPSDPYVTFSIAQITRRTLLIGFVKRGGDTSEAEPQGLPELSFPTFHDLLD